MPASWTATTSWAGGRTRSEADKRRLSHELARLSRREGREILLVFDAPEPMGVAFGGLTRFAGQGQMADAGSSPTFAASRTRGLDRGHRRQEPGRSALGGRAGGALPDAARPPRRHGGEEKPGGQDDFDYWKDVFGVE